MQIKKLIKILIYRIKNITVESGDAIQFTQMITRSTVKTTKPIRYNIYKNIV